MISFFILSFTFVAQRSDAAYPGVCSVTIHYVTNTGNMGYYESVWTVNTGTGTVSRVNGAFATGAYSSVVVSIYWKDTEGGQWQLKATASGYTGNVASLPGMDAGLASNYQNFLAGYSCANCQPKTGQPIFDDENGYPVLVGLPYHAAYYVTVGVCIDQCKAVPVGPVILDQYASDGSGYTVGPFSFDGTPCNPSTSAPPAQPSPEDVCSNTRNACEAQCEGKAYQHSCDTGSCECFGAPSYNTDPPAEPTTPTPDPGSPNVPSPQTAASDPGGDAQTSAQLSNQAKQLGQGDAQLGQLGAMNGKLGAVISNQAKQLGQGDKIIDYQRQQLGTLKDIKDKLNENDNLTNPGVPGQLELDSSLGDSKNWTEHDNPDDVGHARASREISNMASVPSNPLNFEIQTSSSSVLSGVVRGHTIEIPFNRSWMETMYSIMKVILIGLGYLQVFFMINRTLIGDNK